MAARKKGVAGTHSRSGTQSRAQTSDSNLSKADSGKSSKSQSKLQGVTGKQPARVSKKSSGSSGRQLKAALTRSGVTTRRVDPQTSNVQTKPGKKTLAVVTRTNSEDGLGAKMRAGGGDLHKGQAQRNVTQFSGFVTGWTEKSVTSQDYKKYSSMASRDFENTNKDHQKTERNKFEVKASEGQTAENLKSVIQKELEDASLETNAEVSLTETESMDVSFDNSETDSEVDRMLREEHLLQKASIRRRKVKPKYTDLDCSLPLESDSVEMVDAEGVHDKPSASSGSRSTEPSRFFNVTLEKLKIPSGADPGMFKLDLSKGTIVTRRVDADEVVQSEQEPVTTEQGDQLQPGQSVQEPTVTMEDLKRCVHNQNFELLLEGKASDDSEVVVVPIKTVALLKGLMDPRDLPSECIWAPDYGAVIRKRTSNVSVITDDSITLAPEDEKSETTAPVNTGDKDVVIDAQSMEKCNPDLVHVNSTLEVENEDYIRVVTADIHRDFTADCSELSETEERSEMSEVVKVSEKTDKGGTGALASDHAIVTVVSQEGHHEGSKYVGSSIGKVFETESMDTTELNKQGESLVGDSSTGAISTVEMETNRAYMQGISEQNLLAFEENTRISTKSSLGIDDGEKVAGFDHTTSGQEVETRVINKTTTNELDAVNETSLQSQGDSEGIFASHQVSDTQDNKKVSVEEQTTGKSFVHSSSLINSDGKTEVECTKLSSTEKDIQPSAESIIAEETKIMSEVKDMESHAKSEARNVQSNVTSEVRHVCHDIGSEDKFVQSQVSSEVKDIQSKIKANGAGLEVEDLECPDVTETTSSDQKGEVISETSQDSTETSVDLTGGIVGTEPESLLDPKTGILTVMDNKPADLHINVSTSSENALTDDRNTSDKMQVVGSQADNTKVPDVTQGQHISMVTVIEDNVPEKCQVTLLSDNMGVDTKVPDDGQVHISVVTLTEEALHKSSPHVAGGSGDRGGVLETSGSTGVTPLSHSSSKETVLLSHARWQAKRVEEPRSSDENRKSEAEEVEDQLGDDVEPMYAEEGVDDAPIDLSLKLEGTEEEEDQVPVPESSLRGAMDTSPNSLLETPMENLANSELSEEQKVSNYVKVSEVSDCIKPPKVSDSLKTSEVSDCVKQSKVSENVESSKLSVSVTSSEVSKSVKPPSDNTKPASSTPHIHVPTFISPRSSSRRRAKVRTCPCCADDSPGASPFAALGLEESFEEEKKVKRKRSRKSRKVDAETSVPGHEDVKLKHQIEQKAPVYRKEGEKGEQKIGGTVQSRLTEETEQKNNSLTSTGKVSLSHAEASQAMHRSASERTDFSHNGTLITNEIALLTGEAVQTTLPYLKQVQAVIGKTRVVKKQNQGTVHKHSARKTVATEKPDTAVRDMDFILEQQYGGSVSKSEIAYAQTVVKYTQSEPGVKVYKGASLISKNASLQNKSSDANFNFLDQQMLDPSHKEPLVVDTGVKGRPRTSSSGLGSPEYRTLHSPEPTSPTGLNSGFSGDKPKQGKARTKADILARLKWKKTARKSISDEGLSPSSNGSQPSRSPTVSSEINKHDQGMGTVKSVYGPIPRLSDITLMASVKQPRICLKDIFKDGALIDEKSMKYVQKAKETLQSGGMKSVFMGQADLGHRHDNDGTGGAKVFLYTPGTRKHLPYDERYILYSREDSSSESEGAYGEDNDNDSNDEVMTYTRLKNSDEDREVTEVKNVTSLKADETSEKSVGNNDYNGDVPYTRLKSNDVDREVSEGRHGTGLKGEGMDAESVNVDAVHTETKEGVEGEVEKECEVERSDSEPDIPSDLEPDASDGELDYEEWMRASMLDSTAEDGNVFMEEADNAEENNAQVVHVKMYSEEMSSQQESEAEIDLEKMAAAKQRKEHRTGVIKEMEDRTMPLASVVENSAASGKTDTGASDPRANPDQTPLDSSMASLSDSEVPCKDQAGSRTEHNVYTSHHEPPVEGAHMHTGWLHVTTSGSQSEARESYNRYVPVYEEISDAEEDMQVSPIPEPVDLSIKPGSHGNSFYSEMGEDSAKGQNTKDQEKHNEAEGSVSGGREMIENKADAVEKSAVASGEPAIITDPTVSGQRRTGFTDDRKEITDAEESNISMADSAETLKSGDNSTDSARDGMKTATSPTMLKGPLVPSLQETLETQKDSAMVGKETKHTPLNLKTKGKTSLDHVEGEAVFRMKVAEKSHETNKAGGGRTQSEGEGKGESAEELVSINVGAAVQVYQYEAGSSDMDRTMSESFDSTLEDSDSEAVKRMKYSVFNAPLMKAASRNHGRVEGYDGPNQSQQSIEEQSVDTDSVEFSLIDPLDPNIVHITAANQQDTMNAAVNLGKKSYDPAVALSTDGTVDYSFDSESSDSEAQGSDFDMFASDLSSTETDSPTKVTFAEPISNQQVPSLKPQVKGFDRNFIINSSSDEEILKCAFSQQEEVIVISDDSDDEGMLGLLSPKREPESGGQWPEEEDWGSSDEEELATMDLDTVDFEWKPNFEEKFDCKVLVSDVMKDTTLSPASAKYASRLKADGCKTDSKYLVQLKDADTGNITQPKKWENNEQLSETCRKQADDGGEQENDTQEESDDDDSTQDYQSHLTARLPMENTIRLKRGHTDSYNAETQEYGQQEPAQLPLMDPQSPTVEGDSEMTQEFCQDLLENEMEEDDLVCIDSSKSKSDPKSVKKDQLVSGRNSEENQSKALPMKRMKLLCRRVSDNFFTASSDSDNESVLTGKSVVKKPENSSMQFNFSRAMFLLKRLPNEKNVDVGEVTQESETESEGSDILCDLFNISGSALELSGKNTNSGAACDDVNMVQDKSSDKSLLEGDNSPIFDKDFGPQQDNKSQKYTTELRDSKACKDSAVTTAGEGTVSGREADNVPNRDEVASRSNKPSDVGSKSEVHSSVGDRLSGIFSRPIETAEESDTESSDFEILDDNKMTGARKTKRFERKTIFSLSSSDSDVEGILGFLKADGEKSRRAKHSEKLKGLFSEFDESTDAFEEDQLEQHPDVVVQNVVYKRKDNRISNVKHPNQDSAILMESIPSKGVNHRRRSLEKSFSLVEDDVNDIVGNTVKSISDKQTTILDMSSNSRGKGSEKMVPHPDDDSERIMKSLTVKCRENASADHQMVKPEPVDVIDLEADVQVKKEPGLDQIKLEKVEQELSLPVFGIDDPNNISSGGILHSGLPEIEKGMKVSKEVLQTPKTGNGTPKNSQMMQNSQLLTQSGSKSRLKLKKRDSVGENLPSERRKSCLPDEYDHLDVNLYAGDFDSQRFTDPELSDNQSDGDILEKVHNRTSTAKGGLLSEQSEHHPVARNIAEPSKKSLWEGVRSDNKFDVDTGLKMSSDTGDLNVAQCDEVISVHQSERRSASCDRTSHHRKLASGELLLGEISHDKDLSNQDIKMPEKSSTIPKETEKDSERVELPAIQASNFYPKKCFKRSSKKKETHNIKLTEPQWLTEGKGNKYLKTGSKDHTGKGEVQNTDRKSSSGTTHKVEKVKETRTKDSNVKNRHRDKKEASKDKVSSGKKKDLRKESEVCESSNGASLVSRKKQISASGGGSGHRSKVRSGLNSGDTKTDVAKRKSGTDTGEEWLSKKRKVTEDCVNSVYRHGGDRKNKTETGKSYGSRSSGKQNSSRSGANSNKSGQSGSLLPRSGRLSPMSLKIRKAKLAAVTRQNNKDLKVADESAEKESGGEKNSSAVAAKSISPAEVSTVTRLGGVSSRARANMDYLDTDEILHASQSVDVAPKKRRADDVDWSQMFQDIPSVNMGIFSPKQKQKKPDNQVFKQPETPVFKKPEAVTVSTSTPKRADCNHGDRESMDAIPTELGAGFLDIQADPATKEMHDPADERVEMNCPQKEQKANELSERVQKIINSVTMGKENRAKDIARKEPPKRISPVPSKPFVRPFRPQPSKPKPVQKGALPTPALMPELLGNLPAADTSVKTHKTTTDFLWRVLQWNARWLEEHARVGEAPPVVDKNSVWPLLETYDSYDDYVRIMTPLMLMELWESIYKSWSDGRQSGRRGFFQMIPLPSVSEDKKKRLVDCRFQGVLLKGQENRTQVPTEGDLVVIHLPIMPPKPHLPIEVKPVFGYVTSIRRGFLRAGQFLHDLLKPRDCKKQLIVVEATVKLLYRNITVARDTLINVEAVDSITSQMRQCAALLFLPRSPLAGNILRPHDPRVFHCKHRVNGSVQIHGTFNKSQSAAIHSVCDAVREPYNVPKICLLQGPPGTGKTSTIVAMIRKILASHIPTQSSPKASILLCAPSNGGIDELARRLIRDRKKALEKSNGRDKLLNVVRVGNPTTIHPDVQSYSLTELIKRNYKLFQQEKLKQSMPSVHSALTDLNTKITRVQTQISELRAQGKNQQVDRLERELSQLNKKKSRLDLGASGDKPMSNADEHRIRREILTKSDVVCCTLNGSGSNTLLDTFGCLAAVNDSKNKMATKSPFTCVIIDEATQTTEVDSLIPLQYGATKLVLVGDPEQLPATVLSKEARDQNFNQSLFERLYAFLKHSPLDPVVMLQTQYRMHPDICSFPSNHVYYGMLVTDSEVARRRSGVPLRHQLLFDVKFSQEVQTSGSRGTTYNEKEAVVTASLCEEIRRDKKTAQLQIGVITPYQAQKRKIADFLHKRHLSDSVEVGTVDGYQGREKDVVILSCVRANSNTGSIGFLADRRRMNVALTRAKYALYVIGHLGSLKVDRDWRSLIEHAEKHGQIVQINSEGETRERLHRCRCEK